MEPTTAPVGESEAPAAREVDALVETWREIDAALAPIIGKGGVAALFQRSLHRTAAAHPWLAVLHSVTAAGIDLAALRAVLAEQSGPVAAAGGDLLLQTFDDLLASMVGPSLTERLLRSAHARPQSGPCKQNDAS